MRFFKRFFQQRGASQPLVVVTPQHWPDFAVKDRQRLLGREEGATPRQWAMIAVLAAGFVVALWFGFLSPMLSFSAP